MKSVEKKGLNEAEQLVSMHSDARMTACDTCMGVGTGEDGADGINPESDSSLLWKRQKFYLTHIVLHRTSQR